MSVVTREVVGAIAIIIVVAPLAIIAWGVSISVAVRVWREWGQP